MLKKFTKMMLTVLSLCLLVACGSGSSDELKTVKLVGEANGVYTEVTLESQGDKVLKQSQTSTLSIEGYDEETIESFEKALKEVQTVYEDFDFATYSYEIKEDSIIETISMDLSTPENIKAVAEAQLLDVEIDGEGEEAEYISLSETVKNMEDNLGLKKQ